MAVEPLAHSAVLSALALRRTCRAAWLEVLAQHRNHRLPLAIYPDASVVALYHSSLAARSKSNSPTKPACDSSHMSCESQAAACSNGQIAGRALSSDRIHGLERITKRARVVLPSFEPFAVAAGGFVFGVTCVSSSDRADPSCRRALAPSQPRQQHQRGTFKTERLDRRSLRPSPALLFLDAFGRLAGAFFGFSAALASLPSREPSRELRQLTPRLPSPYRGC